MTKKRKPVTIPYKKRLPHEKRKALILEAADKIFCEYGYDGATIDKVAQEADVSKTLVISYYKTKENLAVVFIKSYLDGFVEYLKELSNEENELKNMMDGSFAFIKNTREQMRFIISMFCTPALEFFTQGTIGRYLVEIKRFYKKASQTKLMHPLNDLVYAFYGIVVAFVVGGNEQNFQKTKQIMYDHFIEA